MAVIDDVKKKLQNYVESIAVNVEEDGKYHFEVCNLAPGYGWDEDYYKHRSDIMSALRKRGYTVFSKTNFGVIDIDVTKPMNLV